MCRSWEHRLPDLFLCQQMQMYHHLRRHYTAHYTGCYYKAIRQVKGRAISRLKCSPINIHKRQRKWGHTHIIIWLASSLQTPPDRFMSISSVVSCGLCFSSPRVVTALLVLLRCCYWNTLMIPICTSSHMYHLLSQIWFMLTAVVVISHSCSPQLLNDTNAHKRVHTLEHTFSLCKLETWPNLSKLQLVECC